MQRFIIFRVGQAIIAVLLVSIIVFMLSNITGDPTSVMLPMGEATPEDIAAMARFLSGPGARNITGQAFNVDGGLVMH